MPIHKQTKIFIDDVSKKAKKFIRKHTQPVKRKQTEATMGSAVKGKGGQLGRIERELRKRGDI